MSFHGRCMMIKLTEASLLYVGSYLTERLRDFLHKKTHFCFFASDFPLDSFSSFCREKVHLGILKYVWVTKFCLGHDIVFYCGSWGEVARLQRANCQSATLAMILISAWVTIQTRPRHPLKHIEFRFYPYLTVPWPLYIKEKKKKHLILDWAPNRTI